MQLRYLFFLVVLLVDFGLAGPVKGGKKAPNPIKAAAAAKKAPAVAPPAVPPPAIGTLAKIKPENLIPPGPKGAAPHPVVVTSAPDENGHVGLAQLTHGDPEKAGFSHHAPSSDVIPSLVSQPGFDNRGKANAASSKVGLGTELKGAFTDLIPHSKTPGAEPLKASPEDVNTINNTNAAIKANKTPPGALAPAAGHTPGDALKSVESTASAAESSVEGALKSIFRRERRRAMSLD